MTINKKNMQKLAEEIMNDGCDKLKKKKVKETHNSE